MKTIKSKELVIKREFSAPCNLIWRAYTERDHFENWIKPKGFKMNITKYDFRKGGVRLWSLQSADGKTMWEKSVFKEIIPQEKLIYIFSYSNEKAEIIRSPYMPDFPLEVENEVTLEEENEKTFLTVIGRPINFNEKEGKTYEKYIPGMEQGAKGTYDQLEAYVMKLQS